MYSKEKIVQTLAEIRDESLSIHPYVVVLQPRRDEKETPAQNLKGYEGIHIDLFGYSQGFCQISGEKVDVARNYLLERALESECKYALFVGEDTVLPYYGFTQLHDTAEKNPGSVVAGVYYMKISSPMIMVRKNNWVVPANCDPGQVFEAWQTGMDAMLIPIDVLRKLKEQEPDIPFCCIGYGVKDPKTGEPMPFIGEDNFFVYRLRKAGIKLLVNTDVQCLHMDLASGKYTAHPDVKLEDYFTNIKPNGLLTLKDKLEIDRRWIDRLPQSTNEKK